MDDKELRKRAEKVLERWREYHPATFDKMVEAVFQELKKVKENGEKR